MTVGTHLLGFLTTLACGLLERIPRLSVGDVDRGGRLYERGRRQCLETGEYWLPGTIYRSTGGVLFGLVFGMIVATPLTDLPLVRHTVAAHGGVIDVRLVMWAVVCGTEVDEVESAAI